MENRLKKARLKAGLSQQKLADLVKLHYRTIQDWELGQLGEAKIKNVKKVADELGCKIDDLI